MTTVNNDSSYLDSLRWQTKETTKTVDEKKNSGALTQADFFSLLTQQLAFQDPTKPVENDQMIAQMTSFTMADGISQLNTNFKDFASGMNSNQALQASSLVGRRVRVNSDAMVFDGTNNAFASTEVPANTSVIKFSVYDAAGGLIRSVTKEQPASGQFQLSWDGKNEAGQTMAAGSYKFKVDAAVAGKNQALTTSAYVPITSVTVGSSTADMKVNLLGLGAKKMSDILEIVAG